MRKAALVTFIPDIDRVILTIRNQKVILDSDLAVIYGVSTRRLNVQVKRNEQRFPADFAFQLTAVESAEVVAKCDHLAGNSGQPPTQGVASGHRNAPAALPLPLYRELARSGGFYGLTLPAA